MTGFDGLSRLSELRKRGLRGQARSHLISPRIQSDRQVKEEQGFWDDVIEIVAIPEDIGVRVLGKLFTDKAKYSDWIGDDRDSQASFIELFGDIGLPAGLAIPLGFAASLTNPLDPLNKLTFGLTKAGVAGKAVDDAVALAGGKVDDVLKAAGKTAKGATKYQLSPEKLLKTHKEYSEKLAAAKASAAEVDTIKGLKRSEKLTRNQLKRIDDLNKILDTLQESGKSIDDIRLGSSAGDRIRKGQSTLLGFSSPKELDQLALFGPGRSDVAQAAVVSAPFKGAQAAIADTVGKTVETIGGYRNSISKILGANKVLNEKQVEVNKVISELVDKFRGGVELQATELRALGKHYGLGPEEVKELIQGIEAPEDFVKADFIKNVDDLVSANPQLRNVEPVTPVTRVPTEELKTRLAPKGIEPRETSNIIKQYDEQSRWTNFNTSSGKLILTEDYGIQKTVKPIADRNIKGINKVLGKGTFAKLGTGDSSIVATRLLPGAKKVSETNLVTNDHLDNLEVILARLSAAQYGVKSISPNDILINDTGAVQIVNPSIIKKFKNSKGKRASTVAREESLKALEQFQLDNMVSGLKNKFEYFKNYKTAKTAPSFLAPRQLKSVDGSQSVNIDTLLGEATNAGEERNIVRALSAGAGIDEALDGIQSLTKAKKIRDALNEISTAIRNNSLPTIKPIVLTKNFDGSLAIVDGLERALAAKLLDAQNIPVVNRAGIKETLDIVDGLHNRGRIKIGDAFRQDETYSNVEGRLSHGIFSKNYKVSGDVIDDVNLRAASQTARELHEKLLTLLTSGLSNKKSRDTVAGNIAKAITKQFGDSDISGAVIADGLYYNDDALELLKNAGIPVRGINRDANAVKNFLDELKFVAAKHLENLAEQRILTTNSAKDPVFRGIAAKSSPGTIVYLSDTSNTLEFTALSKTATELDTEIKAFLRQFGGSEHLDPFARIAAVSSDGQTVREIPAILPAKDTAGLAQTIKTGVKTTFSPEEKKRFGNDILINPDSSNLGVRNGFRLSVEDGKHQIPFMFTKSGDMLASPTFKSLRPMGKFLFGDGPLLVQETGLIRPSHIIVDDLLLPVMDELDGSSIDFITRRIRELAQRFDNAGISRGSRLEVNTRIDPEIWGTIYPVDTTLGDVLNPKWGLSVPERMLNGPVNVKLNFTDSVVDVVPKSFTNLKLEEVYQVIRKYLDDSFVREAAKGISNYYKASYFPRILTEDAKKAIATYTEKYIKNNSKAFVHAQPFMKHRNITDLTTYEVNQLFDIVHGIEKRTREGKDARKSVEEIMPEVISTIRKEIGKDITGDTARRYIEIMEAMPNGGDFFAVDPFYALNARLEASKAVELKAEIFDSLKDNNSIFSGPLSDLVKLKKSKNAQLEASNEIAELKALRNDKLTAKENLADASEELNAAEIAKYDKEITELDIKIGELDGIRIGEAEDLVQKYGVAAYDASENAAFVTFESMKELVSRGLISADEVGESFAGPLIHLNSEKLIDAVARSGVDVIAFGEELMPVLGRYFQTYTRDGFGKFLAFWDSIHSFWKQYTLFAVPSYFIRNFTSNAFLGWIGGINDLEAYDTAFKIMKPMWRHNSGKMTLSQVNDVLEGVPIVTNSGDVISGRDVYREFFERGGITGGIFHNEYNRVGIKTKNSQLAVDAIQRGTLPSSEAAASILIDNPAIRLGFKLNTGNESYFKLAAFVHELRQTGDFEKAAMKMKEVFYDYSDLSMFERDVLRRVIPFYTWSRRNIPRQIMSLIKRPDIHLKTAKQFGAIENNALGEEKPGPYDIYQWARDTGLIFGRLDDGRYVVKMVDDVIPFFDAYKLFAGRSYFKTIFVDGLTPFLKFPIEQWTNQSWFTDRPIENIPGERSDKYGFGITERSTAQGPLGVANLILSEQFINTFARPISVFTSTVLNPLFRNVEEDTRVKWSMAGVELAIGRAMIIDPDKARAAIEYKRRDLISAWQRTIRKYDRVGDYKAANEARQRLAVIQIMTGSDLTEELEKY